MSIAKLTHWRLLSAFLMPLLLLAACGGGSAGTPSGTTTTSNSGTVISGVASAGLLSNAVVTAYCGDRSAQLVIGSDITGNGSGGKAEGAYAVALTATCNQPVEIVVTAGSNTTVDDAVQGVITVPANLLLRAFVAVASANTQITQHVTPFTDMAAAVIESASVLTPNTVLNAEQAIAQAVLAGNLGVFNAQPQALTAYELLTISAEEKALLGWFSAISAAAKAAVVPGCSAGDLQCVFQQLAAQSVQSVSAGDSGYALLVSGKAAQSPLQTLNAGAVALGSVAIVGSSFLLTILSAVLSDVGALLAAAVTVAGIVLI